MTLTIPGRLPGLNEIIAAAKSHYAKYSNEKKEYTEEVAWLAKHARLPKFEKAYLVITWFEPDRRRDPDNIMAGQKFIMDGLVQAGVLPGDSQKYIQGIYHRFRVDRKNPRAEVEIQGVSGEKPWKGRSGTERAISILELMAIDLTGTLGGLSETNPLCDVVKQRIAAIDAAQDALREKSGRENRKTNADLLR